MFTFKVHANIDDEMWLAAPAVGGGSSSASSAPAVGGGSSTGGGAPGVGAASSNASSSGGLAPAQAAPAPAVGGTAPTTPALKHPPPGLGLPPHVAAKQQAAAEHQRKQHQPLVVQQAAPVVLLAAPAVGGAALSWGIPVGPASSWSVNDMVKYLAAIALGHLSPIIRENGLDGAFFLQCAQEDLQAIGIGQVQWKKIRMYMPQCKFQ